MDDNSTSEGCSDKTENSSLEGTHVQEVIGLLLATPNEQGEDSSHVISLPITTKPDPDPLPISSEATISISTSSPLNISTVALTNASMPLVEHNLTDHTVETHTVQLGDGTTALVHTLPADEVDRLDGMAKFIDGQAVQLADGTTALIRTTPQGFQPVQLEDGTVAYIAPTASEALFDTEAGLSLEQLTTTQGSETLDDKSNLDLKVTLGVLHSSRPVVSAKALALGDKAFRCTYEGCGRLYTTQHHLKVHERSHTGDRPFKCAAPGCGKAFATGYGLKSHTRVHTGETPYKCPEEHCHKAFKTSGDLQKHVRTHTGERPFKCPFEGCDRAFTTSNIRKVHIRTHTGERPYVCKEEGCGRAFASATNYKNHIRIHTGEKPYMCTVQGCGKKFTEYSSLYKHHVVHTHSKPYRCDECGKTYRQTSTLAMHKRTAHGIIDATDGSLLDSSVSLTEESNLDDPDMDSSNKEARIHFHLESENQDNTTNLVIHRQNARQIAMVTTGTSLTNDTTIVALQAQQTDQDIQQLQDGTVLSPQPQQILVVTDPSQFVALQQLAQFEHALIPQESPSSPDGTQSENDLMSRTDGDEENEAISVTSPITVSLATGDPPPLIACTTEANDL
ncbi:zinc finger protein 76-like isoform X2 [Centruroides vittatus]|uniref:zinc finger protein 76-like isoform X2 n=1 Tax=Centruroides vittatus TaxID=120091 RepID=UPI0035102CC9